MKIFLQGVLDFFKKGPQFEMIQQKDGGFLTIDRSNLFTRRSITNNSIQESDRSNIPSEPSNVQIEIIQQKDGGFLTIDRSNFLTRRSITNKSIQEIDRSNIPSEPSKVQRTLSSFFQFRFRLPSLHALLHSLQEAFSQLFTRKELPSSNR